MAASKEEVLDELLPILDFEDTKSLLQSEFFADYFLIGSWRAKNEWKYLNIDENGHISYNLPWIDYGDYYRIEDGDFLLYKDNDYDNTKKLFTFKIINADQISIYCHKDGSRYNLFRQ